MPADAGLLTGIAQNQTAAVIAKLWCVKTGCFVGVEPTSAAQTDEALCYDSFMPYLWGMISDDQYIGAFEKIFDERLFWDEFPVASAAKTNLMYWSGNCLVGPTHASVYEPHSYPCSWNGPSWHYANGLLVAALGAVAENKATHCLKDQWLELFARWTELHFLYGDRSTPCAVEHHRPADGARFRNIVDYFHNAWLDPLFSYYLGIRIGVDSLEFQPFFQGAFKLAKVTIGDRQFSFEQRLTDEGYRQKTIVFAGTIVASSDTDEAARLNL